MKSHLAIEEFTSRLMNVIADEQQVSFITPYDFSGKPFRGKFDNKYFPITRNIHSSSPYYLKGEYSPNSEGTTDVKFTIIEKSGSSRDMTNIVCLVLVLVGNLLMLESPFLHILHGHYLSLCCIVI